MLNAFSFDCLFVHSFVGNFENQTRMTEKWPGPAPGVHLIEVSVKRELTVLSFFCSCLKKLVIISSSFKQ